MSENNRRIAEAEAQCPDVPPSLKDPGKVQRSKRVAAAAGLLAAVLLLVAVAATVGGCSLLRSHAQRLAGSRRLRDRGFLLHIQRRSPTRSVRESSIEAHEKENCSNDCKDLLWALCGIPNQTLKGLAWINFKQLGTFSVIAQKQARMSYYASLVAASISLLTLVSGAAVAISLQGPYPAKLTVSALATVGSVLSGFLAKTFLESYRWHRAR